MEFKDPIYNVVNIEDEIVEELLKTKSLKRLKNIKQQGNTYLLFDGCIHNRFEHSIGVYKIMCKILNYLSVSKQINFTDFELKVSKVSAILHDVGHGPFSHCFEDITLTSHKKWTELFIKEDRQIRSILKKEPGLFEAVLNVLMKKGEFPIIQELLFSELGADKLDYMKRDLYYSGFSDLSFDLEKIVENMIIYRDKVNFNYESLNEINNFFKIKKFLFENTFYHPFVLGKDILLKQILKKISFNYLANQLKIHNKVQMVKITDLPFELYSELDDEIIYKEIIRIKNCTTDKELKTDCENYLNPINNLYWVNTSKDNLKKIIIYLNSAGYNVLETKDRNVKYSKYNGGVKIFWDKKFIDLNIISEPIKNLVNNLPIISVFYH